MNTSGASAAVRPVVSADDDPSPDQRLVRAFTELRDELISTLMYLVGNREDAQDAAQDAFAKCWRSRDKLADVQNLRAWIFRVGLNSAKDMRRSAWHRRSRPLTGEEIMIADHAAAPADLAADREALDRLRRAILDLREEEKEVFLLRQNGGLTYEQIAEVRGAPVGTVKTQMRAALQKLRKVLT
jgi:RNA polymerase sigma-70 factor (ECF subfamily)